MGPNILVSRPRPVRSRDVSCHVTTWFRGAISYRWSIVTEYLSPTIFEIMGILYICVMTFTILGHVTSSVTWPFDSQVQFPIVIYCNRVSISNHFRHNGHFIYLGHDLDLSGSRDVIGHVTNRSAICHFLLVSLCNRTSISNRFRDIRPRKSVRTHRHTHRNTPQVILYSVPCNVLHWTDNNQWLLLHQLSQIIL